jgi:hypothetical protein
MIKFYLKTLAITAALLVLGMLFGNLTMMGLRLAAADALVKGVLLASALTAVLGTLHVLNVRRAAGPNSGSDIYSVRQVREVSTRLEPDRAFAVMRHYLEGTAGLTVTSADPVAGKLEARSGLTLRTFGNKVTVSVSGREGGGARVTISSGPLVFALADFGESLRAADAAADHLRDSSHA